MILTIEAMPLYFLINITHNTTLSETVDSVCREPRDGTDMPTSLTLLLTIGAMPIYFLINITHNTIVIITRNGIIKFIRTAKYTPNGTVYIGMYFISVSALTSCFIFLVFPASNCNSSRVLEVLNHIGFAKVQILG